MGGPVVRTALKKKRARWRGSTCRTDDRQEAAATGRDRRCDQLFSPQTNPELIPAIRPYSRSLFFDYGELARPCYETFREAGGPLTTGRIADYAILAKGLDVDRAARKGIVDIVRKGLGRMEARGRG